MKILFAGYEVIINSSIKINDMARMMGYGMIEKICEVNPDEFVIIPSRSVEIEHLIQTLMDSGKYPFPKRIFGKYGSKNRLSKRQILKF
ncbi:hypothetical protein ACFL6O_04595 [candidate division KSB1 bacterium]